MFGKSGMKIAFFILLLTGCARPKTESSAPAAAGPQSQEFFAADCSIHFQASGDCLSWRWEKAPTSSERGSLIFKIYRANVVDGTPVELDMATMPSVVLWMPSMGHGSSPASVQRLDVGTYRAFNLFFVMPGIWQIKFQVPQGDQVQDEVVVAVTI